MDGWVDGWTDRWVDGWMGGWMDGWVDGWVDGWMDGWMDGWVDGWMGGWEVTINSSDVKYVACWPCEARQISYSKGRMSPSKVSKADLFKDVRRNVFRHGS